MLGRAIQLLEYQMVRALCRLNLVQTVVPGWRQIESEMALDLNTIHAVSALGQSSGRARLEFKPNQLGAPHFAHLLPHSPF